MRAFLVGLCLSLLALLHAPAPAAAQDRGATILVLDASNSMWGQIDGINKIVIAREVITDLLGRLPEDLELGLTVYGHSRNSNCSDIETLVPPGIGNREEIARLVNTINPRGRTPLSAAVIQAAQELRYTEGPATVILVSDGRETCDMDPCAVGRALEEAGVDFTAHVIGFDVAAAEDIAQLQCLAENTGGQFLTASNAEELTLALEQVAVAPPPAPVVPPVGVTLRAVVVPGATAPTSPLMWEVFDAAGVLVLAATEAPSVTLDLAPGDYQVWLTRVATGTQHGGPISVIAPGPQEIVFELPALIPEATLTAPAEAPVGATIPVAWTGPGAEDDTIILATADRTTGIAQVFPRDGSPLMVTLPDTPGDYLLQYVYGAMTRVLAEAPIRVTPPPATLTAPESAVAGSTIEVGWTGPGLEGDFIGIGRADGTGSAWRNYSRVSDGNPLSLLMPPEPGDYVIGYFLDGDNSRLAMVPITVTPAMATIEAPASAPVAETVSIGWTGPDYPGDFIGIGPADGSANGWQNYTRTSEGSPLGLQMPATPGDYLISYYMDQDNTRIASVPITVTEVLATLEAPATAIAGETIAVHWTGPDLQNDFIGIGSVNDPDRYTNYTYTREGTPAQLQMPTEPGDYEIRYFVNQDRTVIARLAITVTEVVATLEAASTAAVGETIPVHWTGPDYHNDFIGIGPVDEPGRYTNYAYTREGTPAQLQMPTEPGDYEIRYFVNQDRTVIARHPITLTEVVATLEAAPTAAVGETIPVHWTGPDYHNDFIGIGPVDEPDRYTNYAYTREGTPVQLQMPTEPGDYEIRYFVNQDRTVIARHPITLTETTASLEAPASAAAGDTISVGWQGPDYRNDFIGIGPVDDPDGYSNYAYTRDGSPVRLEMPTEPGSYEIRYFVNQDRTVIARRPIEVMALVVTLSAPASAVVGETVTVTWDGPDYRNDFLAAALPGDSGYETYVYTRDGNPARLRMPSAPGRYEIRYYVNQDRSIQARVEITVEDVAARLIAAGSGPAGGTLMVEWEGPDYRSDFIAIAPMGEDGHDDYAYTRDGSPVRLDLPEEPGAYELRYIMNQDRRVLATLPFTVTAN